ncbi:putative methionine--tRNA ligase [Prunus yedoensis var. nudiflora]|uniref:Putative methionine--tRNA ligase n=1 Tax=Prunus yedoensis var. nudiflora TaxID=2094558 RepID=A0A314ZVR1_PRUYE|nr:putative methionine--tRNA ligase [Prunus yedoensis var. nudiflora]
MAANGSTSLDRKQLIASALCKHFSLDPKTFPENIAEDEITSFYTTILKSAKNDASVEVQDGVLQWIRYADGFPTDPQACFEVLKGLNDTLADVSVLLGNGFTPSEADVIVFAVVHSSVIGLSNSDRQKLPHLLRWVDHIQNKVDFGDLLKKIVIEKVPFDFLVMVCIAGAKSADKVEIDSNAKKTVQSAKSADKPEADLNTKKSDAEIKATEDKKTDKKPDKKATQEKKKSPETEAVEKDKELSVSLLNIQVGLIRKAWKHPSADSLLVEEIDVGDAKLRQVVSGLAKYCSPEELTNRKVVLITNVKPGKLRDVASEGLVLCASNEDHTLVEPLLPPEGAKPGERVSFSGVDGKPEDVLNPKKKQLEKITPHLFTDDKGVATFKGIPFMTSAGPCTSSIPKASIK